MKNSHQLKNNVYIVFSNGTLNSEGAFTLNQYLKPLILEIEKKQEIKGLLLDFSEINSIDSAGIGMVCAKLVRMKKLGKKFAISNVNRNIYDTFQRSNLDRIINFYNNSMEGLHIMGS